jgi:putative ABC transport system ATP-binding protein
MTDAPLISLRGVSKSYRRGGQIVPVLNGITLDVQRGDFLGLMGPSGSGKSTLLNLIAGIDKPDAGEIFVDGVDITRLGESELADWRAGSVGFVFQFYNLMPVLTAFENVELPLVLTSLSRSERRGHAEAALGLVGLADRMEHYPSELSGGQQQRVAIARALVTRPALLFADEPTGNLDYTTGTEILDALWRSCTERGQTVVLVTHDSKAAAYADRVLVIGDGRIRDTIELGRRESHDATPLIARLAKLGL